MMKAQKQYLGDINSTPRYDIYLYLAPAAEGAPGGFGALEHHTSTVVVLPEQMPDEALASSMIDVVSPVPIQKFIILDSLLYNSNMFVIYIIMYCIL